MRWLVTGAGGMLGHDAVRVLRERAHEVTAADRRALDVMDPRAVTAAVAGHDVVWNCAAFTAVDAAEEDEDAAWAVNAAAPATLGAACAAQGARLVQVSTDYVFDGASSAPYPEGAELAPRSAYGRTKAAGEQAVRELLPDDHLVVRTAWLYGAHGRCFPRTIARLARERGRVQVVDDQHGQPTWTCDVADLVVRLVEHQVRAGTYHATASGSTTWAGFAREVVAADGGDPQAVQPVTTTAFPRPAPRPAYSVLGHDALTAAGVRPIGPWRERWACAAGEVLSDLGRPREG
ncbi:MAG TPA: dTDP-4-dehydrorhamnose reductase [Nocardioidaceae bacterium]|jgi:dTDP-4-dehydrorhamnose reductase|nr:dTDP-4-dehydrorhamnose reductase [Nocardioidaceae bacterium]